MQRTTIRELYAAPQSFGGKQVTLMGWARTLR